MIDILTTDEIDRVLRRQRIGRLACATDAHPDIAPINDAYAGTSIDACSGAGREIDVIRRPPNVCFLVDEIAAPSTRQSVVASGSSERR